MSDDELWSIFNEVVETLTDRMVVEKRELKFTLARLNRVMAAKPTDETAKRRNIN
jgi:hypothetical protein